MTSRQVPLLDLKRQYSQVGDQLEQSVIEVLRSGSYILGENVSRLEQAVARICGQDHAVGVANGTDALVLALWALDIGPGDEVITPSFTFAATAEAIALRGAKAVFVDVEPRSFNLDASRIEAALTPATRAIMPVHLYGQPADMDAILDIAGRFGLKVIEDNAQAIGASYRGRPTGSFGKAACISFYPTKNLGAAGDAGMVVTGDARVAERLRALRAHGSRRRYYHDELGVNSRLDEIQAAILLAKLPHLARWNDQRNQVAQWYSRELRQIPSLIVPEVMPESTHVWHQYTVRIVGSSPRGSEEGNDTALRDVVANELARRGIGSMCYYPVPLHLQEAFKAAGYRQGDFPISEALAGEVLSLPMYPELTEADVQAVAGALREILTDVVGAAVNAPTLMAGI